jgi:hypothetical protein
MQPHGPFLGETADQLREEFPIGGDESTFYAVARDGKITQEQIRQAYSETLGLVIDEVEALLQNLHGKTVVSADHGELLGEEPWPYGEQRWGHPHGVRSKYHWVVPWLEIEGEERRTIRSDPPERTSSLETDTANERLKALGYQSE